MTMTNNPTIDGVSRETAVIALRLITRELETLANGSAIQRHKAALSEIRALLDSPVVERQPAPFYVTEDGKMYAKAEELLASPIVQGQLAEFSKLRTSEGKHADSPEVAALRSTIALLEARVKELEIDAVRIDFWQSHPQYAGGFAPSGDWSFFSRESKTCYGKDLRSAFDQMQVMHGDLDATAALNEARK